MRGRKPTPTALKIIAGNPGKRPLNAHEPQPRGELIDPPEWMTDRQKDTWREVIELSPPGLLKDVDGSVFAVWVVAFDLYQEASDKLARTGMLIKAPNTGVPMQSPYLAIVNKQAQIMMKAAAEMGFTPASRSRVVVKREGKKVDDPWGAIAGG
ncbi:MAG: phage terminase small subunit P27 family [Castellaniella sp.]|uniref:phage terminase small subunit P27 family n=1 Tax=Castellaniella sp. TaxID=1955812 RepID=UPI003A8B8A03